MTSMRGDMERGKAFYSGLFGREIAEFPGFEGYPMWQAPNKISGGGGLAPRSADFTQPRSYVEVDSIEAGVTVVMEKLPISETSWWAVITDPDGNAIGLYEGVTDAG